MKALIQRVSHAQVDIAGTTVGNIGHGLLVLLGVDRDDDVIIAQKLLHKVLHYRVFPDQEGRMNCNVKQAGGSLLVVSQFTLAAATNKGMRPSFTSAAAPAKAQELYHYFHTQAALALPVQTGEFGANMQVSLCNDGPVTFMLAVLN